MLKIDPIRLFDSKDKFKRYVSLYNEMYRVDSDSKHLYIELIGKFRRSQEYRKLILKDSSYIQLAYRTLEAWNMNQRGARLADFRSYERSITENIERLSSLSRYRLETLNRAQSDSLLADLWVLFNNLVVMTTKARIVGVSKTLHFLLPDLIMPVDRANILSLLYLGGRYSSEPQKEFADFKDILLAYSKLAQHLGLSTVDVDGVGWNMSIPKLIDNAIIGFISEITSNQRVIS